jgi:hypothetical protein
MRGSIAVLLVLVGMLVGYSLMTTRVSAQPAAGNWVPFTAGEIVKLTVDFPEGLVTCTVSQVVNGFLGCSADQPGRRPDRWINMRYIKEITRRDR